MATSNDGGANTAAYEGGGAGGKFRKKPLRRAHHATTPYDRPPTALRGTINSNNNNNASLFTKLVVDPASKLISYGAQRFFASVFRKRLPPPPPQPPEINGDLSDDIKVAVSKNQCGVQKSGGGDISQPLHSSSSDGISELEQLLKQKTFSRSEIDHLTELLRSRAAVELSLGVDGKISEATSSDLGRHQAFASSPLDEKTNEGDRSHGAMSTPISNSRVIEDDMASPAELAKAYMGSRPSKVSPSMLGMRSQVGREDTRLLGNMPFASKPSNMAVTMKTSVSLGAPENGFITPKSRGRSAIYNMARTPYSRINPLSIHKGCGLTNNGYGVSSMSSSSHLLAEHNEKFEPKPMALKRRSSVLDDDLGSIGPIRRIRQKPNLLTSRNHATARGAESGSDSVLVSSRQRLSLSVEPKIGVSKTVGENEDDSIPSASYTHVPSKSSEVAARILQHLEKLTPKEKSSESKLVSVREKSQFRLTPSMLRGQALRSMEDVDSSKLLPDVHDDHKLEDRSTATLTDARDSTPHGVGKLEENVPKESGVRSDMLNSVMKNDFVESLKAPGPSIGTADLVKNSVVQPSQKKRAFRMSAQEDSLDQDDDLQCYGLAPRSLDAGRGPTDAPTVDNGISLVKEPKLVKTTIQPEVKMPLGLITSKTSESGGPGASVVGEGSGGISLSPSEEASAAIQSKVLPNSIASFDKSNGTNDSPPLFSFSSKAVDNLPLLPFESSSEKAESKSDNSSWLVNVVSTATGSQTKILESNLGGNLNPLKAGDANGNSHPVPFAASNGPLVLRPPVSLFTAASSYDANQLSTFSSGLFTSSTGITSFGTTGASTSTSISAASSDNPFGSNAAPSIFGGPVFKFGASVDPSTAVSAASTTNLSELTDLKAKTEKETNFGSSSGTHSAVTPFEAANSGSNTLGLSTSVSNSTVNNLQGSLFGSASKSLVSGVGTVSQSTSIQFSSASLPSLNMNSSTSVGTSVSNSQFNSNQNFVFSSSVSKSDTTAVTSGTGPTLSVGKFGVSSTVSDGNAVSSSAGGTPGVFSFGLSSSSSPASAVVSSNGATPPVLGFGGSSVATSLINTVSSFSSGTSGIFSVGASSSASSSAINSLSSNGAASNVFGSTWESPKSLIFGSTFTSPSPSTGFSFGASSTTFAPSTSASMVFNSSSGPLSSPIFPFATASSPALSSPSLSFTQPLFGNKPSSFASSPGNGDQMNAEDSMAEDPVQCSAPSIPVFGQPAVSPSPPVFMFGSTVPTLANPFQFSGQPNQIAPQNPSPFQASGSLEFNAGGSFSLGSGVTEKSNRKFVKVNRNKNRKK